MPAPAKPTEHQKSLAAFEGRWQGTQKLSPAPWDETTGTATTTIDAKMSLGGLFVVMDYVQKRPDNTTLQAHLVLGYNAGKSEHQLFWFDTQGSIGAPFVGKFEGGTLRVTRAGARAQMKMEWSVKATQLTIVSSTSTDGKTWTPFSEGTFQKT